MPQPEASRAFYLLILRLQLAIITAGRRAWLRMDPADFDRSWAQTLPGLLTVTTAGQLAAARAAAAYVPAVLAETGAPVAPEAAVRPRAFAGVAADGRSLQGLLAGPVVRAKKATRTRVEVTEVDSGMIRTLLPGKSPEEALAEGGRALDGLLKGIVTDAARGATQAEIAVRPNVGYVRMVSPPCCGRCAILAGRKYPWNAGFPRHPGCDCIGIPATEDTADALLTNPQGLFDAGLINGLTARERERLANGDDLYKVINESRDMWRARIAEQKSGGTQEERDARDRSARQGLEDLFASTRSRVDAMKAMREQGFITD